VADSCGLDLDAPDELEPAHEPDADVADDRPPVWWTAPIMELREDQCRYIAGPSDALAVYCGTATEGGPS
jgi:hypothetical protein